MIQKWVRVSFLYLLLVGLLGCLLRLLFFMPVAGVNFKYFLHAHSHVAFLGWIFNALFAALLYAYLPGRFGRYKILFVLLQLAVLGMLFTFPFQGYAAASIVFSTLHIFLSYWFAIKFWIDTSAKNVGELPFSLLFVRWGLVFMVISSLGPFALGVIMAKGLGGTNLYQLAIYFYLHFQYDGWFTFAVLGLFFRLLEHNRIGFNKKGATVFLWLMVLACIPAYTLSALWTQPHTSIYVIAGIAAVLQVIAIAYLFYTIKKQKAEMQQLFHPKVWWLLKFSFAAFVIKIILQLISAFPIIADLAYQVRNFTIGYLHIVFLGFISVFLIAWFIQQQLLQYTKTTRTGIILFITGFVVSELIIFLQPGLPLLGWGMLPYSYQLLFIISLLMPFGVALLLPGIRGTDALQNR